MTKSDTIAYLVLITIGVAGVFIGGYWGGLMTGAGICLVLLSTIGRQQANKAAGKIDKSIRDMIIQNNKNED